MRPGSDTVLFRGGAFSNFAASPFELLCPFSGEPRNYATVEHFFQASKAVVLADHVSIATSESPKAAKQAGRRIALRPDWEHVKVAVMLTALRAKFAVDPFRSRLLATEDRPLAEDSPYDFEWGIRDRDGGYSGENRLGTALMQVRAELRASTPTQLALDLH